MAEYQIDRQAAIAALKSKGVPAYEYHSGGGFFHVAVTIYEDGEDIVQIATGEAEEFPMVGLMGWRDGSDWESDTWEPVTSDAGVVDLISSMWKRRAAILADFKTSL